MDYLFDLTGTVVGLSNLAFTVVYARLIKHIRLVLPWQFILYGAVLLGQTLFMPGALLSRLLSFAILCGGFMFGSSLTVGRKAYLDTWWASAFALFIIADALTSGGRSMAINPNKSSALLLMLLPYGSLWLLLAAILCTGSRGAMVGMSAAVLITSWPALARLQRLAVVALIIAGAVLLCWLRMPTIIARLEHWSDALQLFASKPLTGWGPGSYVKLIPGQAHADSAPLTLLAEQGLIGVAAIMPLIYSVSSRGRLMSVPLLALLIQNVVDDTWGWAWVSLALGLNLALLYADKREVQHAR